MATIVNYTGDGSTNTYAVTFDYIARTDVVVKVNEVAAPHTFVNDTTIQITSTPASGAAITIQRATPLAPLVDFTDGSTLFEADLDLSDRQSRFLAEEARDRADSAITTLNNNIANINTVAGISSDVTTVSGISANVTTVANDGADIGTVAGISSDVTTVSGISANVSTVAGVSSNVSTVASNIASVNTVATNIADVITVANDLTEAVSEVETVANDLNEAVSEIDTVANNIANITTVANANSNINTLAGINANITAVANDTTNIGTVATNIANVNAVGGISANVTTVAGISTDVTSVAGLSSNIQTIANSAATQNINTVAADLNGSNTIGATANAITNINSVGSNIASVNTVANNLTSVNSFGNQYVVGNTTPSNPNAGLLWFDTSTGVDTMKVYNGLSFQNAGSSVNGTSSRGSFTATAGQTTFTTSGYDPLYIDIFANGVKQVVGTDVTASNGTTFIFASPLVAGDVVEYVAYGTFALADHYNKTQTDALLDDVEALALAGL